MGRPKPRKAANPRDTSERRLAMSFDMWLSNCERLPQRLAEALSAWLEVEPSELPARMQGADLDSLTAEFNKAWRERETRIHA